MEFHDQSISKWEDEPRKEKKESKMVSSRIEKEKKDETSFEPHCWWNPTVNPFQSERTNLKRKRLKNQKRLVFGMKRKKKRWNSPSLGRSINKTSWSIGSKVKRLFLIIKRIFFEKKKNRKEHPFQITFLKGESFFYCHRHKKIMKNNIIFN